MRRAVLPILVAAAISSAVAVFLYTRSQPGPVEIVTMAVDDTQIGLGLNDGSAVELSVQNGALHEERRIAHCSGAWMNAISFTSSHELVCSGERLRIVDRAGTQREISVPRSASNGAFGSVAEFNNDLAVITANETILLLDASGKIRRQLDAHTALYGDVRASRDGKFIAASGHTPHVWSTDLLNQVELAHSNYTFGPIAFSATRLYMGNQDGCVYEWSVGDWTEWPRICINSGTISQIAVSPDGTRLAISADTVALLATDTLTVLGKISRDAHAGLAFLDNAKLVTSTGSRVELWDCLAACRPTAAVNVSP